MFRVRAFAFSLAALLALHGTGPVRALEYVYLEEGGAGIVALDTVLEILAERTGEPTEGLQLLGERAPYPAEMLAALAVDENGDPYVTLAHAGVGFTAHFHECDEARPPSCGFFRLRADFPLPEGSDRAAALEAANDWNRGMLNGTAYVDGDGYLHIELAPVLPERASRADLERHVDLWLAILAEFASRHAPR